MNLKWKKKGLVYSPKYDGGWMDNSALTPTAFLLNKDVIRVYAGFRDTNGISRIGYVDVSSDNPSMILKVSEQPVLDVGEPGMFDDNGVILGDIINVGEEIRMYYVGFQLVKKAKFLAYTGLAVSNDGGDNFDRISPTPILDRTQEGKFIRAIHSVLVEDGVFKVWYATGNGWETINNTDYPQYDINYIESRDGISFPSSGNKIIKNNLKNKEYRIGRPRVHRFGENYLINFTYGTTDGRYEAGQAISSDGVNWIRDDKGIGITVSQEGWDSKHLSYPSLITVPNGKTYMFYNGNDMGREGFGYAELVEGAL
ncbi:glycoside hydrolase family protein [Zobellella denitrificans]|uniref:hypothetical protein n=1 Tax=Zobellella denitrificans TaxID=347534 RepID=UPI000BBE3DA2|nr:hypothetical protein [Zobellella denitrificans]